jgi:hypothetical protein
MSIEYSKPSQSSKKADNVPKDVSKTEAVVPPVDNVHKYLDDTVLAIRTDLDKKLALLRRELVNSTERLEFEAEVGSLKGRLAERLKTLKSRIHNSSLMPIPTATPRSVKESSNILFRKAVENHIAFERRMTAHLLGKLTAKYSHGNSS